VLCPRRGAVVELTAAGHERIERTLDELLTHEQRLLAGLAEAERDRLEEALRALLATLEDHLER
jgi:DNA-binding MarR family transcriptional regulator